VPFIAQMRSRSVDEAFMILRGYCRNSNLRLSVVAHAVVTDARPIPGPTKQKRAVPVAFVASTSRTHQLS
jgi:hypothetical protein